METKKINDRFSFENSFKGTRSGFNHHSNFYDGLQRIGSATCQYLNRTWESYSYQTSMKKSVRNAIDNEHEQLIERFKREFSKNRTTKQEKQALYDGSERISELNELLTKL